MFGAMFSKEKIFKCSNFLGYYSVGNVGGSTICANWVRVPVEMHVFHINIIIPTQELFKNNM